MTGTLIEKVFFQGNGVKVTNARFINEIDTYAISGINSVKPKMQPAQTRVIPGEPGREPMSLIKKILSVGGSLLFITSCSIPSLFSGNLSLGLFGLVSSLFMVLVIIGVVNDKGKPEGPSTTVETKPAVYTICVSTSSGEQEILKIGDKVFFDNALKALNDAIVARG